MCSEIGSEFWIDNHYTLKGSSELPCRLNNFRYVTLTTSGRGALSLLLEHVNPSVKRALLPAYICESVILPFEKAGYELIFYNVDKLLRPDDIEFIEKTNVGVFLHLGYFGFQTNAILEEIISKLRSKTTIIIEDVTHTLFSNSDNLVVSDFIFGSIRKWFGIPSGGFMASNIIKNLELPNDTSGFAKLREKSLNQKFEYINSNAISIKSRYLSGFKKAENILDENIKPYKIDSTSEKLIQGLDIEKLQIFRKNNYETLIDQLNSLIGVKVIFNKIHDGITPFFLPVYIKHNRNKLIQHLIREKIYCPVHWPIPRQLKGRLNNGTKEIYDSILSIPCDQRYQDKDMVRVADEIRRFVKG